MPKGISRATQRRIYHLNGEADEKVNSGQRGLCEGQEDAFVGYETASESQVYQAQMLCNSCPLLLNCRARARIERPAWGVWGGEVWRDGKIVRRQRVKQGSSYLAATEHVA